MRVSAVVISHGHARELEQSLPALAPQVDELLVIANVPGSVGELPEAARVVENPRPLSFAANANAGFARDDGRRRPAREPGRGAGAGRGRPLAEFMAAHPRAGVAGPQMRYPDGTWQPARRRFPTVAGTHRPPHADPAALPAVRAPASHYYLDERPTSRCRPSRCSARSCSSAAR